MPLVDYCIANPVKVAVGVILVALFGLLALFSIPVQLKPDVSKPTVTVETRWPGASPQEVEKEIVDRQEEQLKSLEGMIDFKSESTDGQGKITMEFGVGTDMSTTLLKVANKLDQVREYPQDADEPRIESVNTSDSPIAWIILQPLPPTADELEALIADHPNLKEPLKSILNKPKIDLPQLVRLAKQHPELKEVTEFLIDTSRLRRFAEDEIETRLERVEGVANSNVIGGREEEMQIVVDPVKLAARRITIPQLRLALVDSNADVSAGDIWESNRRYVVRTLGQFDSTKQVENVVIARRDGASVFVKDVATVKPGYRKPQAIVRQKGLPGIAINVQRDPQANVLEVMEGVKQAIAEMNDGVLASRGLRLEQVYDETTYIGSATRLVRNNLLLGSLLAVVILMLFLRSGRSTLVIALSIPISIVGTFLIIFLLGRSINVISLAGMAFAVGMVVDAAIVVLENIFSHYQRGATPRDAASRGTAEVWGAVLASTLTTLAVFLPVIFVQDQAGQLFRDIAIAISAAVALSLIVSVLVIPVAASRLLKPNGESPVPGDQPPSPERVSTFVQRVVNLTRWLQTGQFGGGVKIAMCGLFLIGAVSLVPLAIGQQEHFPYIWTFGQLLGLAIALAASAAFLPLAFRAPRAGLVLTMIVLSVGLSLKLMPPAEYLPEGNRNLVIGILLPPPGYNFDQMIEIGERTEQFLAPYWEAEEGQELDAPAIDHFFFVARGRSIFMGARAVHGSEAGGLVPLFQRATAAEPGMISIASQASLFESALSGGRAIDIEISGPDLEKLISLGQQVMGQVSERFPMATTGTFVRPVPSLDLGSPEIHVRRNREKASQRGVNTRALGYTIDALVDGAYAGDYWHHGKKIDLTIIGAGEFSERTQSIAQLHIGTPTGEMVPLSAITDVTLGSGPEQVNRIDRQRAITIQVKPGPGVPLESAMKTIQQEIVGPLQDGGQLENGRYSLRLAGTADELKQMLSALSGSMILAVVITFLLIAALYESFLYPIVIMISVPMAAVGGFLGLRVLNLFVLQSLDALTMLGFVILVGTVVNNAILIVNQALVNIRTGGMPHREAVTASVQGRIRPIFMSTTTTIFGMLPLVLWPGAGSELYRGLGCVVLGGLLVSTVFTLVLVPMLFTLVYETVDRSIGDWRLAIGDWRSKIDRSEDRRLEDGTQIATHGSHHARP